MDPDLPERISADSPDVRHETTDQKTEQAIPKLAWFIQHVCFGVRPASWWTLAWFCALTLPACRGWEMFVTHNPGSAVLHRS